MSSTVKKNNFLIFLCWLVYVASYFGRYSYSANIKIIQESFAIKYADSGLVTTCFFFAYGAGQIINGLLCKRYEKRSVLTVALFVSAILNFVVFMGVPFGYIKYLWLVNGAAQSVLWSSLTAVLADSLEEAALKKAVVVMSTTTAAGTLLTYGSSALFSLNGTYKYAFLCATVVLTAVAFVWFFFYKKAITPRVIEKTEGVCTKRKEKMSWGLVSFFVILGVCAVVTNLVKDGLSTWVPAILSDKYALPNWTSILLTLVLPALGICASFLVTGLHKKISDFLLLTGITFIAAVACIAVVVLLMDTSLWSVTLVMFGVTVMLMHGANSIITSMVPMYMRDKVNSGASSGVLNGCAYVGSTISSYGLGLVADNGGWNSVFYLLLGVCLFPVLVALVVLVRKGYQRKNNKGNGGYIQ